MHIHIKREDERLSEIAEGYGVWEDNLRRINDLRDSEGACGEELLILTPTRSYAIQRGDSIERIAMRFGVRKRDILAQNPWINDESLRVGDRIALKYGAPMSGMAVANGYFYKGCNIESLRRALPYLTYVTFGCGVAEKERIYRSFYDKNEVDLVTKEKKIPLIRIYDRYADRYKSGEYLTAFAEGLIELAKMGGYKGIVLNSCHLSDSADVFLSFLMISFFL